MPHAPRLAPLEGVQSYLDALRDFDRNVTLFLTTTALRGMGIAAIGTVYNLYLYSLGYDARFIGVINAVNALAVLLVSLPIGYLADRFGQRPVLLVGGGAYPLTILALALAHSTPVILLFNFLWGGFSCAYWVAGIPLLYASTRERERVHAFSINSFFLWGLGPLGALLSGQAVEIAAGALGISASSAPALRFGLYFMVVLAVAGAVPNFFITQPPRAAAAEASPPPPARLARLFTQLLIPDLILAFGLGALLTFSQLYFHLRFHLDAGPVGLIMAVGGVIAGVGTLLTPGVARAWGNLRSAVRLQWSVVPMMVALALAGSLPVAVPAYWLLVTLRGMSDPVYTAFVQERVPELYRARLTGFYSVTYSLGFSLGPAASGQLQKAGGFTAAFLMAAAVYVLGPTLLYLFFGRGRHEAGVHPPVDTMVETFVDGGS
jgi:MFS family permease